MKSFSPIKLFTPVIFFLVMCLTMISWGETGSKNTQPTINLGNPRNLEDEEKLRKDDEAREERSEAKQACKSAQEKLEETLDEATNVCSALTNRSASSSKQKKETTVNDCSKKIDECDNLNKAASSGNSGNPEEQQNAFGEILGAFGGLLGDSAGSSSGACMEEYSTEANDKAEKDYKDDKKELEKDMAKLQEDIIDDEKGLNEKLVDIEKKINELNKDDKKDMRDKDKEMRELLKTNSDSLVVSGKKVRDLNKKMLATQKAVKRINFNFKNTESERASQKIALQCNQAIQTAKKCMLEAYQNKGAAASAEVCKDVPKVLNRGTKATAEFKKLIQSISDTCYERLNADKANKEYENQQAIENANEEMTELQAQLKDELSVQQNAQTDLQKIAEESVRENNELAAALANELETLAKEQMTLTQNSQKSVQDKQKRIKDLESKIAELDVRRKIKAKSATKIAKTAVGKSSRAYDKAQIECGCSDKEEYKNLSKKAKDVCDRMRNPEKIGLPEPKPKKATKDKSAS